MKAITIGTQVSAAAAFIAAFFFATAPVQAEDLNAVYQQGRAAFYRGDMATAQALLSQVAAANPKHVETQRMLGFIRANHKPAENTLKNQYATVILPKVEMADVSLTEAVEALRALSKNASGGKVTPNVIVKGEELGQRKLSLTLANVPLTEALNYVTQLVDAKATYDKHAVILSSQADSTGSTAATK
ncbi:MAG: hypothetical protein IAE77_11845 [Prosthecobacter sp.]|uniref:hypothetical protein n=1 Tax=Prosthecobacter sp. TaxID=1965333 RepID=UPI001A0B6FE1|nr:hypothetical protein [Prosthecobacter sp.]MBE2284140.1 hypothetical protein [Prosthecobacter sp.]